MWGAWQPPHTPCPLSSRSAGAPPFGRRSLIPPARRESLAIALRVGRCGGLPPYPPPLTSITRRRRLRGSRSAPPDPPMFSCAMSVRGRQLREGAAGGRGSRPLRSCSRRRFFGAAAPRPRFLKAGAPHGGRRCCRAYAPTSSASASLPLPPPFSAAPSLRTPCAL